MNILDIALLVFIVLESVNVLVLYFRPNFPYGNGVGTFVQWDESQAQEERRLFARYMVNWVAGSKLIFIALLVVILLLGDDTVKVYAIGAMLVSIATYYFKLHPLIARMDAIGQIKPKGYSRALRWMISGFLGMFAAALVVYLL